MAFGKFRDKQDSDNTTASSSITSSPIVDSVLKPLTAVKNSAAPNTTAFIGSAASIVGTLKFDSSAEIGAYIEGEIHSSGRLTILETGVVKGSVTANELIIKGKVQGDVKALTSLALCKPACITGDISTPILSMESGVVFEGRCTMPETKKAVDSVQEIKKEDIKPVINNLSTNA